MAAYAEFRGFFGISKKLAKAFANIYPVRRPLYKASVGLARYAIENGWTGAQGGIPLSAVEGAEFSSFRGLLSRLPGQMMFQGYVVVAYKEGTKLLWIGMRDEDELKPLDLLPVPKYPDDTGFRRLPLTPREHPDNRLTLFERCFEDGEAARRRAVQVPSVVLAQLSEQQGMVGLPIREAARLLGVDLEQLEALFADGRLPLGRRGESVCLPAQLVRTLQRAALIEQGYQAGLGVASRYDLQYGASAPPLKQGSSYLLWIARKFLDALQKHIATAPVPERRERDADEEAAYEFSVLFGRQGRVQSLSLGDERYGPARRDYHPDNLAAGVKLAESLRSASGEKTLVSVWKDVRQDPEGDLLVVGGPVTTPYSRVAFEFQGADGRHQSRRSEPIVPLRWWGVADESDPRVTELPLLDINIEGIGWVRPAHWFLFDRRAGYPLLIGTRQHGLLNRPVESFLTITRLPNFVSPRFQEALASGVGPEFWPSILVIDGRNGIATRAAELLLSHRGLGALSRARDALGSARYGFQLLFKVGGLSGLDQPFDSYSSIEFVGHEVIDGTDDLWLRAHEYARRELGS